MFSAFNEINLETTVWITIFLLYKDKLLASYSPNFKSGDLEETPHINS